MPGTRLEPSPSECCWDCIRCKVGYYSDEPGMRQCIRCGEHFHTNENQTECLPNRLIWVAHSSPLNWCLVLMSSVALVALLVVTCIVIYYHKLVVITRIQFKTVFLIVTAIGSASTILHLARPDLLVCIIQQLTLLFTVTMHAVILFAQADITALGIHFKFYTQKRSIITLTVLGVLLNLLSLAPNLPEVCKTVHSNDTSFLVCHDVITFFGMFSAIFSIVLTVLAAFIYERMKDLIHYNNFACYIFLVIISVFVPVYVTLDFIEGKIAVSSMSLSIAYIMLTALKFVPPFYEIFVEHHMDTSEVTVTVTEPNDDTESANEEYQNHVHGTSQENHQPPHPSPTANTSTIDTEVPVENETMTDNELILTPTEKPVNYAKSYSPRIVRVDTIMRAPRAVDEVAMLDLDSDSNPRRTMRETSTSSSSIDILSYV